MTTIYCADADLNQFFGESNVDTWADLDGAGIAVDITARRLYFRTQASQEVDDRLRNGPYAVPFSADYPLAIIELAAELAGTMLYDARRIVDIPSAKDAVFNHREKIEKMFKKILGYTIKFDIELQGGGVAPRVVE